jgi:hypothetical protein
MIKGGSKMDKEADSARSGKDDKTIGRRCLMW